MSAPIQQGWSALVCCSVASLPFYFVSVFYFFFFFQAEDGIRDSSVTGVQTCALPISATLLARQHRILVPGRHPDDDFLVADCTNGIQVIAFGTGKLIPFQGNRRLQVGTAGLEVERFEKI